MTGCATIAEALGSLKCSGDHQHQPVEGSSGGMLRSVRTQVYPHRLIRSILGAFVVHESHVHWCFAVSQASVQVETFKGENRREVERAIQKLHVNLGHASEADMERVLTHHHASEAVLELVRGFECMSGKSSTQGSERFGTTQRYCSFEICRHGCETVAILETK